MNELAAIIHHAKAALLRGDVPLLATVVATRGSSYRRPGARMLVTKEGWKAGSISGGCLEADIIRRAQFWASEEAPILKSYDTSVDDEGAAASLGCGGELDVLMEPLHDAALLDALQLVSDRRMALTISTVLEGPQLGKRVIRSTEGTLVWTNLPGGQLPAQAVRVFEEHVVPAPKLVIVGAGHDAVVLSDFAVRLGWDVHVIDWRAGFMKPERFPGAHIQQVTRAQLKTDIPVEPGCAVIVMSHHADYDRDVLHVLGARSDLGYLGVLGPKDRTRQLLEGTTPVAKICAPAGLHVGGDGPAPVALSILAEAHATLAGVEGAPLRLRQAPIHSAS